MKKRRHREVGNQHSLTFGTDGSHRVPSASFQGKQFTVSMFVLLLSHFGTRIFLDLGRGYMQINSSYTENVFNTPNLPNIIVQPSLP